MTIGTWLSTHPPLCRRLEALDSELTSGLPASLRGIVRAVLILVLLLLIPGVAATFLARRAIDRLNEMIAETQPAATNETDVSWYDDSNGYPADEGAFDRVESDLEELEQVVEEFVARNGLLPADADAVYAAWTVYRPGVEAPIDPCDGQAFGYETVPGGGFRLWSCGPDGETGSEDDLAVAHLPPQVDRECRRSLDELAEFVRVFRTRNGVPPPDAEALYSLWATLSPDDVSAIDPYQPFAGDYFGYLAGGGRCSLWSVGPDGIDGTPDDIVVDCS
jgi:hypothetical protein